MNKRTMPSFLKMKEKNMNYDEIRKLIGSGCTDDQDSVISIEEEQRIRRFIRRAREIRRIYEDEARRCY